MCWLSNSQYIELIFVKSKTRVMGEVGFAWFLQDLHSTNSADCK